MVTKGHFVFLSFLLDINSSFVYEQRNTIENLERELNETRNARLASDDSKETIQNAFDNLRNSSIFDKQESEKRIALLVSKASS